MSSTAVPCPVGCGRRVTRGLVMCTSCWLTLPIERRGDVERTWRTFNRSHADRDWAAYRRAFDAAVELVQQQRTMVETSKTSIVCPACGHSTLWEGRCWNPLCDSNGGVA